MTNMGSRFRLQRSGVIAGFHGQAIGTAAFDLSRKHRQPGRFGPAFQVCRRRADKDGNHAQSISCLS
jgi:hypothetical protein